MFILQRLILKTDLTQTQRPGTSRYAAHQWPYPGAENILLFSRSELYYPSGEELQLHQGQAEQCRVLHYCLVYVLADETTISGNVLFF